uniref:Uncharacterized protein n=1 Tax=Anguilla anguilla TaxID=7936 RepID=A0A0E9XTK8_ANGAN
MRLSILIIKRAS